MRPLVNYGPISRLMKPNKNKFGMVYSIIICYDFRRT